jgi:hypothetical protein
LVCVCACGHAAKTEQVKKTKIKVLMRFMISPQETAVLQGG